MSTPRVGVLALQGDVREHAAMLRALGVEVSSVRRAEDLAGIDGLVIPGGESSVIDKLSRLFGVAEPIRSAIADGLPVLGTCAGLIMLADTVHDAIDGQESFGGLDVTVRRNAFGRQAESFDAELSAPAFGSEPLRVTFIRGPVITDVGTTTPLVTLPDGRVVAVERGALIGVSFHPEITGESRVHERFLAHVRSRAAHTVR
ncbi:5'-phosphate synthase pdxT subunit [Microbacterium resistens]|uniref:Pyridoxal 5'-phosphate synthase subunit PdxT n=1 Tax=Microbacterium resistens TaxID=156977 RepID=A0ABU1SG32_9MICO|nr:pyridoxal 5'-phosphate synthase glutaminase subunit PdxT [Microbacterium resistens]MDR6868574.1 5'-phosphate synthase pdxT subunit [Microbacterium resistens]